jgi:hypothetical protein
VFYAVKKIAPAENPPERFEKFVSLKLANLGAEEFAVALEANFSAAEKISHRRDRLLGVASARTNGEDQIAERKFGTGLEDEAVFLHCFVLSTAAWMPLFNLSSAAGRRSAAWLATLFRFPLGKPHRQDVKHCEGDNYKK